MSFLLFVIMLTGNALWSYYGFKKDDFPIISTNIFSILLNSTMIILKYRYKDNK